jgi:hypothetical protein
MKRAALVLTLFSILYGCATSQPQPMQANGAGGRTVRNELFEASLVPVLDEESGTYSGFYLVLKNMANEELLILWDKTAYVQDGTEMGGFMFKKTPLEAKDAVKSAMKVGINESFSETIFPGAMVFNAGRDVGWFRMPLPSGESGINLVVGSGETERVVRILLSIPEAPSVQKQQDRYYGQR